MFAWTGVSAVAGRPGDHGDLPIFIGTIPLLRKTMSRAVTPHLIESTAHPAAVHVHIEPEDEIQVNKTLTNTSVVMRRS